MNKLTWLYCILIFGFLNFIPNSVYAQRENPSTIDTTVQNDSFRTLQWVADSLAKAIVEKKSNAVLGLYPGAGIYIKYSQIVAPDIPNGTVVSRYTFYKLKLSKKHQRIKKDLKKAGLTLNKASLDRIDIDTGVSDRKIIYCRIRVHFKRNKQRFFIEANGIQINNQWFIIDGFNVEREEDI